MKKLEISQMENLQGTGQDRKCLILGATTSALLITAYINPVTTIRSAFVSGGVGAFFTSVVQDCY